MRSRKKECIDVRLGSVTILVKIRSRPTKAATRQLATTSKVCTVSVTQIKVTRTPTTAMTVTAVHGTSGSLILAHTLANSPRKNVDDSLPVAAPLADPRTARMALTTVATDTDPTTALEDRPPTEAGFPAPQLAWMWMMSRQTLVETKPHWW